MALGVTARGSGTNGASANPLNVSPSGNFAAGSFGVLCVTADNNSSGGATNDLAASMTDSLGNLWTLRQAPIFDNGAAAAGVQGGIYTSPCAAGSPTTATTIPISTGVAAVAKGWSLYEITKAANAEVAYVTGGVNAGATTGTPTVTTPSVPVGDVVIGGYHAEGVAATTGDSDATNGSWTAQVTVTVGSTTSGIRHSTQAKIQTTAASAQTFNPTATSQDCILSWVQLHEQHTASAGVGLTGGGVVASAASKQGRVGAAFTGGGVEATGKTTARNLGSALTGGGTVILGASGGRRVGAAATASGTLVWGYDRSSASETHSGSFTMTGGGTAAVSWSTSRSVGRAMTAGGSAGVAVTTARAGMSSLTGGGALAEAGSKSTLAGAALTGGGLASLSLRSARLGAALLSGGGVLSSVPSSGRRSGAALTGGGIFAAAGSSAEDHAAGFALTGAGRIELAAATARLAASQMTGAGSLATSAVHAASASLFVAGGGRLVLGWFGEHVGGWALAGGGRFEVVSDSAGPVSVIPQGTVAAGALDALAGVATGTLRLSGVGSSIDTLPDVVGTTE